MKDTESLQKINLYKDHDDVLKVVLRLGYPASGRGTVIYDDIIAKKKETSVANLNSNMDLYIPFVPCCMQPNHGDEEKGQLC